MTTSAPRIRDNVRRASIALATAAALALTACSDEPEREVEEEELQDALEEGGELLIWGWGNALPPMVEEFTDQHPQVEIELVNVGTGDEHYTAIENAVAAGSGIPDIAVVEYFAVPQFALNGSFLELTPLGAAELEGTFTQGTWDGVHFEDGIYGLPMSSGPMALFYNETIFDEHGVEVPGTWEEYLEAARELNAADPEVYITSDTGSAGQVSAMLWQQQAQTFAVDGDNVSIDLQSAEADRYAEIWQQLLDDELLAPISTWSDEWYQGLANGAIATLTTGAWMPANLESGVEAGAGDWRVAPMPQWSEGDLVTAEEGGAGLGILEDSDNHELAYAFLEWATAGEGVEQRLDNTFPATVEHLESEEFLAEESEYFGGQRINEVLAESAAHVAEGWTWLPYQPYANSIFADHMGPAYNGEIPLSEGLTSWQEALISYGNNQGFVVNE